MKLVPVISAFVTMIVCLCGNAKADGLEAIVLNETRTFSSFTQRGEVYYKGAFVCFMELRGIDAGIGGLDDSSSAVSAISGHGIASHTLKVTLDANGVQQLVVVANDRMDSDLLLQPSALDRAKNGIYFHLGDGNGLPAANARLAQIIGSGKTEILVTSLWLPEEVHRLTGYERPSAGGGSPQSVFSPGMSNASNTFTWTCAPGADSNMLVKAIDTHRARIEIVLQSLDAGNQGIDLDQGLKVRMGTTSPLTTLFSTPNGTARKHRFLINPEKIDSQAFPPGSPSNSSVWVLAPTLVGGQNDKALIKSVSVDLFRGLPVQVWNHKGVEKRLTIISPLTLNPEKSRSLRVQWKASGFSEDDKIRISGILESSIGAPTVLADVKPYQGFEDGLNGMVVLDPALVSSIGAQPSNIKLIFEFPEATP